MDLLEHTTRKHMAVTIVRSVLKSGTLVREVDQVWPSALLRMLLVPARLSCVHALQVDMLFKFISLLIKDDEAHPQEAVRCRVRISRIPCCEIHLLARVPFGRRWMRRTLKRSRTWWPAWCTTC